MRANALANLVGKAVASLAVVVAAPWQIALLGPAAFGLVGLYSAWLSLFLLFDFGLGMAFTRELSRRLALNRPPENVGQLVKTVQRVFALLGLATALLLTAGADWIVDGWLHAAGDGAATWRWAVVAMGVGIGLQIALLSYQATLSALERQVVFNVILSTGMLLRQFGVLPLLTATGGGAVVFFVWQAVVLCGQLLACAVAVRFALPPGAALGGARWQEVRTLTRVAGPLFVLGLTATLLSQMDKLVLSALLPMEVLGRYTLAALAASAPNVIGVALQAALYPRLSREVAVADQRRVMALYRLSSLAISVVVVPTAVLGCVHAREWLTIWTADPELAAGALPAFRYLLLANLGLNLLLVPFTVQLAHADVRLALTYNTIAIPLVGGGMVLLVRTLGPDGVALVLAVFYVGQLLAIVPRVHKRWLPPETMGFWLRDVLVRPTCVALAVAVLSTSVVSQSWVGGTRLSLFFLMAAALGVAVTGAAVASVDLRHVAREWLVSSRRLAAAR